MAGVIFSFDAQAVGLLTALDAITEGLGAVMSAAENVASSFISINSTAQTLSMAMTNMFTNFDAITGGADSMSQSLSGATSHAANLAYQLQQLSERASDMAAAHLDAVNQIAEQEANLTENTKEEIANREQSYTESMQKLVQSHQDALQSIQDQEDNLTATYADQMNARLLKMKDPIAVQHQTIVNALQQQIDAMLASGNTAGIASLEAQLNAENSKYNAYINNVIKPYYKDLDEQGYAHHQRQLKALQDRLNKENSKYAEQTKFLKDKLATDLANYKRHFDQQEQALDDHLAKENQKYAEQVKRLNEERAHIMDSGGGSSGGAGGQDSIGAPPPAGYIDLLRKLGINPVKNPKGSTQAVLDWILGQGAAGGLDPYNPRGLAFGTQMTIPQVEALVNQAFSLGQDPTRAVHGGENYVNLFSDLLAYTSGTAPGRTQDDRYSSLMQIMEKVMSGNTTGLMRQFANLGISPDMLASFGVKFGGTSGKTIKNPSEVYDALMKMAFGVAGGEGKKFGTESFTGLVNQFKDLWSRAAQEIGDPSNPKGLWAQMQTQVTRLLNWMFSHEGDIVSFGQKLFGGLIKAFGKFLDFVTGPQGTSVLHSIGDAFKKIGDALHWLGQHQGVLHMLLMLLGAHVGADLLGGLPGIGGVFRGGLTGMAGRGMGAIANSNPVTNFLLSHFGALTPGAAVGPAMGQFFGGIGTRFGAGRGFAEDAGGLATWLRGMAGHGFGLEDSLRLGGGGVPGYGPLASLGMRGGVGPWAGRLGGLLTNPGEALGIMGRETVGNVRTAGTMAGLALRAAPGVIGSGISGAVGAVPGFIAGLPAMLGTAATTLGPALAGIAAAVGPILLVAAAVAGLVAVLVMNRDKIMPFINLVGHFLGSQLKLAAKAVTDFVHQVQERLGPAFGPGSLVYKIVMDFAKIWMAIWPGIQRVFEGVWNVIAGVIKIAWSLISGIILIGLDILGGKWGKVWTDAGNMVKGVFGGIWQVIKGVLQIIQGAINVAISFIYQVIVNGLTAAWHFIIFIGTSYINFWKNTITAIVNFFLDLPKNIMNIFKNLGSDITSFFTTTMPNALGAMWHAILNAIKWVIDQLINTVVPGPLQGPVHSAIGFAQGGRYPGKELSIVGERGPELFFSSQPGVVVSNDQIRQALLGVDVRGRGIGGKSMRPIIITGAVHVHGVQDPKSFYQQMNKISGLRAEFGERGSAL